MRCLAVDPGGKKMGIAVGDTLTGIAGPLEVIPYNGRDGAARTIVDRAQLHGATLVVIGLPTSLDGDETAACARSRALAGALASLGMSTEFQPEYLSTNEARHRARAMGRKPGQPVDDLAAQVILEEFFARRRPNEGESN